MALPFELPGFTKRDLGRRVQAARNAVPKEPRSSYRRRLGIAERGAVELFRAQQKEALHAHVLEPARVAVMSELKPKLEREERKRRSEQAKRERKRQREREARQEAERFGSPADVDTLGLDVGPDWLTTMARLQRRLRELGAHAQRQAQLAKEAGDRLPERVLADLLQRASAMRAAAHDAMPHAVCPHCRLVPALLPSCRGCSGFGYITKRQAAEVESAFWRVDHPLVMGPDGRPMELEQARKLAG